VLDNEDSYKEGQLRGLYAKNPARNRLKQPRTPVDTSQQVRVSVLSVNANENCKAELV